jgi:hypothetical protein
MNFLLSLFSQSKICLIFLNYLKEFLN